MIVNWIQLGTRANPLSVKVLSNKRTSVVSNNNSIWIQHWNYLEHIGVSQELRLLIITDEILNDSLHHVACIALSRMDPGRKDYGFSDSYFLRDTCKVSYNQHVDIISRERFTEDSFSHLVLILESASLGHEAAQVGVGVGVAVREVHSIVVVLSCPLESQAVVHRTISIIRWLH